MDTYARWNAIENEKRAGLPPIKDPTTMPQSSTVLRIRREQLARDVINSRAWDNFHATPPTHVDSDALRKNGKPVYYDMNPQPSRLSAVQYRIQPEYIPNVERGPIKSDALGVPPAAPSYTPPADTFSGNAYTQRLDAGGSDARNMIRELRGSVVEDNREVTTDIDRHLAQRQFYDRWLPARTANDAASLQAYELLRPKGDSWHDQYAGDGH